MRALLSVFVGLLGCGPSLRGIYRGDVYFERCYGADLDTRIPVPEKHACWSAWMAEYQAGQPEERVDYARERILRLDPARAEIVALAVGGVDGDTVPLTESEPSISSDAATLTAVASGEELPPIEPPVDLPGAEEQATEPSAEVASEGPVAYEHDRRVRPARRAVVPTSDASACVTVCRPAFETCAERCTEERNPCLRACRLSLRACAHACY
jgi:hypothetical protein